jgi:hypothetical protein
VLGPEVIVGDRSHSIGQRRQRIGPRALAPPGGRVFAGQPLIVDLPQRVRQQIERARGCSVVGVGRCGEERFREAAESRRRDHGQSRRASKDGAQAGDGPVEGRP